MELHLALGLLLLWTYSSTSSLYAQIPSEQNMNSSQLREDIALESLCTPSQGETLRCPTVIYIQVAFNRSDFEGGGTKKGWASVPCISAIKLLNVFPRLNKWLLFYIFKLTQVKPRCWTNKKCPWEWVLLQLFNYTSLCASTRSFKERQRAQLCYYFISRKCIENGKWKIPKQKSLRKYFSKCSWVLRIHTGHYCSFGQENVSLSPVLQLFWNIIWVPNGPLKFSVNT